MYIHMHIMPQLDCTVCDNYHNQEDETIEVQQEPCITKELQEPKELPEPDHAACCALLPSTIL